MDSVKVRMLEHMVEIFKAPNAKARAKAVKKRNTFVKGLEDFVEHSVPGP